MMNFFFLLIGTTSKFLTVGLQALAYAQQSRECSNYEQASLIERMQEYKRQIDRESRHSSNGSHGSPNVDSIKPSTRNSHKVIEAAMQSAVQGKVLSDIVFNLYPSHNFSLHLSYFLSP